MSGGVGDVGCHKVDATPGRRLNLPQYHLRDCDLLVMPERYVSQEK